MIEGDYPGVKASIDFEQNSEHYATRDNQRDSNTSRGVSSHWTSGTKAEPA